MLRGLAEQLASFFSPADEPELVAVEELQGRLGRVLLDGGAQAIQIIHEIHAALAVQLAGIEIRLGPIRLQLQALHNRRGRFAKSAERELGLGQQEEALGIFRIEVNG